VVPAGGSRWPFRIFPGCSYSDCSDDLSLAFHCLFRNHAITAIMVSSDPVRRARGQLRSGEGLSVLQGMGKIEDWMVAEEGLTVSEESTQL
jgi:hypothetical protein